MMQNPTKFGWMIKQGGGFKSWKRRFFMLVNDKLYYFEKENSKEPNGTLCIAVFCLPFVFMENKHSIHATTQASLDLIDHHRLQTHSSTANRIAFKSRFLPSLCFCLFCFVLFVCVCDFACCCCFCSLTSFVFTRLFSSDTKANVSDQR
jgi:hypothetical protein